LFDNHENFWQKEGSWKYYLTDDAYQQLKEKALATGTNTWDFDTPKTEKKMEVQEAATEKKPAENEIKKAEIKEIKENKEIKNINIISEESKEEARFGNEYKSFVKMSTTEKIDYLNEKKKRLNDLTAQKNKDKKIVTETLVDTTRDAAMINHAALEEAMRLGDNEAKRLTQDLVASTHEIVKTSTNLITESVFDNELMKSLVEKSNGTIVQHMTRVYINGIAFMAYYNKLVSTSNAILKLRLSFDIKYRDFYHDILSHLEVRNIVMERVFYGGMRAISPDLLHNWAIGFLIHDIGKAAAVEYHEGEESYNRDLVTEHVKLGYQSILKKTNYPMEASLITGYHHEYYGDASGYGYYRAFLELHRKTNPHLKQDYCISYDLAPIKNFQVLAYFPAKVLEIIDVYDSVTDPFRVYRKPMTPDEALAMIRQEFIRKTRKIDPILFDIFADYIRDKESKKK